MAFFLKRLKPALRPSEVNEFKLRTLFLVLVVELSLLEAKEVARVGADEAPEEGLEAAEGESGNVAEAQRCDLPSPTASRAGAASPSTSLALLSVSVATAEPAGAVAAATAVAAVNVLLRFVRSRRTRSAAFLSDKRDLTCADLACLSFSAWNSALRFSASSWVSSSPQMLNSSSPSPEVALPIHLLKSMEVPNVMDDAGTSHADKPSAKCSSSPFVYQMEAIEDTVSERLLLEVMAMPAQLWPAEGARPLLALDPPIMVDNKPPMKDDCTSEELAWSSPSPSSGTREIFCFCKWCCTRLRRTCEAAGTSKEA
mmetsp:Transcript_26864/g.67667  ORF Transcript_26864/g.67667 Transcript_26864/m.67667 type:complete len:313 (+) Transcript_26864:80-1018(+)